MPLLACRRLVLGLAAASAVALVTLPASAAEPAQLIQSTANTVIEIIKNSTPGAARQASVRRFRSHQRSVLATTAFCFAFPPSALTLAVMQPTLCLNSPRLMSKR